MSEGNRRSSLERGDAEGTLGEMSCFSGSSTNMLQVAKPQASRTLHQPFPRLGGCRIMKQAGGPFEGLRTVKWELICLAS